MFWGTVPVLLCLASQALGGEFAYMINTGCDFGELVLAHPDQKNGTITRANCDTLFRKKDWINEPQVTYSKAKIGSNYLLLMLDPDAPNHGPGVFYFHWAVANIPGFDLRNSGRLDHATTLLNYTGPNPPKGTGQHRYVFLLYEQDTINDPIDSKLDTRAHFDLGRWINPLSKRYPLTGPVAGSQFRVPAE